MENQERTDLKSDKIIKEKIKSSNNLNNLKVEGKMSSYIKNGRRYYTTKREALIARRKGDRIYYDAFEGAYYIVGPSSKKSFWGW